MRRGIIAIFCIALMATPTALADGGGAYLLGHEWLGSGADAAQWTLGFILTFLEEMFRGLLSLPQGGPPR